MIQIILPYDNASEQYHAWANEEEKINFREDIYNSIRCTLSFAAEELCQYLKKLGFDAEVTDEPGEYKIYLLCKENDSDNFSIDISGKDITISGEGRRGTLYGVYEFLEAQGIRWYSPWEEYVPENADMLKMPKCGEYAPSMSLGRGFDFEGPLKESKLLYLWMARNKLNISTVRSNTKQLQRKLGMTFKIGGHIFEKILDPKQKFISGKTMFEEHPDWYGKTSDPINEDNALHRQFCVSNQELLEYLWQQLLKKLQNEWYDADRIDVWGFDTWGKTCQCKDCIAIGNGSDQTLHFIAYLRKRMNEARVTGELDHDVRLVMCSYEGTATIETPKNGIPEQLKNSGDYIVFYPILRCYAHQMEEQECRYNSFYQKLLEEWKDIPMMVGEYYNVSKFEELPLLFTKTMQKDFINYYKNGVLGMTYMHLPMIEWGMKTLTQLLYAKLSWNVDANVEEIINKYFQDLYGEFKDEAKNAYMLTEEAGKYCANWRSWGKESILTSLLLWDGESVQDDLCKDEHLKGNDVQIGMKSAELLEEAKDILTKIRKQANYTYIKNYIPISGAAINPNDKRFWWNKNFMGERISQDIRNLIYGIDVYKLMAYFVEYYNELKENKNTDATWNTITALALKMESYSYGVKYSHTEPELFPGDVFERSGLKNVYYKCLAVRCRKGLE